LFKRRKPDEPAPSALDITLPAGLPEGPDAAEVEADPAFCQSRQDVAPFSSDSGLGVPPFRPAPCKEVPHMSRPPFSPVTNTPASTPLAPARPGITMSRPPVRDPADRRTLVVGRGISVQGTVQDAERLVVEGTVESTMIHATELEIAPGGIFKGEIEVEDVEIAGTIDGTLTARGSLTVRSSGRVLGTARCRRLQVEDGGQITGRIEMISDGPPTDIPPRQSAEPVASSLSSEVRP
jgi:cytoskeletal protein CcmA (bactofilin family)